MIHTNSLEAYKQIMTNGSRDTRLKAIFEILIKSNRFMSDYEVLQKLKPGSDNMNLVRPRITEAHQSYILEEGPPRKSHDGNLNVRTSRIKATLIENQMELF